MGLANFSVRSVFVALILLLVLTPPFLARLSLVAHRILYNTENNEKKSFSWMVVNNKKKIKKI